MAAFQYSTYSLVQEMQTMEADTSGDRVEATFIDSSRLSSTQYTEREDRCLPLLNSLRFVTWIQLCLCSYIPSFLTQSHLPSSLHGCMSYLLEQIMESIYKCTATGFHGKTKKAVFPARWGCQSAPKPSENVIEIAYTEKYAVSVLARLTYSFRLFGEITVICSGFSQLLYHLCN